MKITDFDQSKHAMDGQYAMVRALVDQKQSKDLYRELKKVYCSEKSKQTGKGRAIKYYFEHVRLFINPNDIFADLADVSNTPVEIRNEEYKRYKTCSPEAARMQEQGAFFANCDFGHTMPDWNTVFDYGIPGIIKRAEECLGEASLTEEQIEFYLSVKYAYEGILVYVERLRDKASDVLSDNARFAAQNLAALAKRRPETLAEAMQLYFIYYTAQFWVEGENVRSLGALDDILFPYYRHDMERGLYSEADVRQLIKYFLYKWNSMNVLANIPFCLGTNTNEFTYLILEEYRKLNVPDPKIHIKCTAHTPDRLYRMIMDSIRSGNNSFVFINDEVASKALERIGIEGGDARNYTIIGCYEPAAAGREIPCTLNGRINMPMAVEVVLNRGKKFHSDDRIGIDFGEDFADFEGFYDAVKKQLKEWTRISMEEINAIERQYPDIIQSPILSATFQSCMERGKDAYAGGAKYSNSSICAFGIATVVDELMAIKKAVFEEKIITLEELKYTLKNNWKGAEALRKTMRDKYPKYGNNDTEADSLTEDLLLHMAECINHKPNGRGGVYRMGLFSIDWIIPYGKQLGASADGRLAGEPVSKNLCASVGMDKKGVTGIVNSVTKFDYSLVPNGSVLDLSLHPSAVSGDEGIDIMVNLLKTYLSKGGFATHLNVVNPETLKEAQQNPDKYRNLQVRLCGWNVYFTDLDTEMQNNLIKSMEEG